MRTRYYTKEQLDRMTRGDCAAQMHATLAIHLTLGHADAFMDLLERMLALSEKNVT